MTLVRVGTIGRPHGVDGELTLVGSSLTPDELLSVARFTWRGLKGELRSLMLEAARPMNARLLVRFGGVAGRDAAAELTRGELLADREKLPDPGPNVAYTFQLLGLRVATEDGRALGTLADIVSTGAHPIYVVQGERELLVPATAEVVRRVDLAAGEIVVRLPAGLEEL